MLFLAFTHPCLAADNKHLVHVLEQLRSCSIALDEELSMVGRAAADKAGTPYVQQVSSNDDLRAMLKDGNLVVRIIGAANVVKKGDRQLLSDLELLAKDTAKVFVAQFGCNVLKMTVAEVVSEMKKHPR